MLWVSDDTSTVSPKLGVPQEIVLARIETAQVQDRHMAHESWALLNGPLIGDLSMAISTSDKDRRALRARYDLRVPYAEARHLGPSRLKQGLLRLRAELEAYGMEE